ncbi:MAG: sugar transferase [Oscillospiraceae bacterium]|nr:sugar transferase [Oscillospiraceae bacterium]
MQSGRKTPGARGIYNRVVKRFFDIVISALGLIVLSPVMLVSAILIRLTSPGPAIFRQKRIGLNAKEYTIYKFRTMRVNSEHTGSGVYSDDSDPRMTGVGRILRRTSIDELPQLINILRGDMSLIGPRPPLTYHPWPVEEYTDEQLRMFEVRPGITGWAQVHGRKDVEWHKRIRMNVWYVDHVSFPLDLKIFFITIGKVFTNADNENKGATVAEAEDEEVEA